MAHSVVQILKVGDIAELARGDPSDGQLLDLFVHKRDEEAFAAVVRRHGPMVLGVCRRVLGNFADAEDAFQAAFLVLARKAASLGTRNLLAQWLHGVAYYTARRLRRANARRATRERPLTDVSEPVASEEVDLNEELLAILDEELGRLPERYRVPIVLCDLEGTTRREAARLLGCPEGTVAGRLARARALLAERIASRGFAPTAGVLAILLPQRPASAITQVMVANVTRAAFGGAVSARVVGLTEGVLTTMFLNKLKSSLFAMLLCGLAIAGLTSAFRADVNAGTEPAAPPEEKPAKSASDAKVVSVIPLRKLDADETAKVIADVFKGKGVTVAAIPDERSLLLYADAKTTREVDEMLIKLGEVTTKKPSVIRLKNANCTETAKMLREVFNGPKGNETSRVTIVPVSEENALLVYATPIDTLTISKLLAKTIDAPGPGPVPMMLPAVGEKGEKDRTFLLETPSIPVAWKDALAWYVEISGLKFVGEVYPTGTVTLHPPKNRKYTVGEITDLLNEAMIRQKFILIRRETSFILHPADEKIDPTFIPRVKLEDLSQRGKTELVEVEITLSGKLDAAEVGPEIQRLLTPFGEVAYAKGKRLVLRDTAGNVKRVIDTLRAVEADPRLAPPGGFDPRFDPKSARPRPVPPTMPMAKTTPFKFKDAKWDDVLDWYSKVSGLTPILTVKPKGKFTFTPPNIDKEYTIADITDILNEALAGQKLILVRRQVSFKLHDTDEKIDPSLVPRIELSELPTRGKTELVQVIIPLKALSAEDTAPEIKKLLTPFGTMSMLRNNSLVILDTAGNIARIWETIQKLEGDEDNNVFHVYQCQWKRADDVVETLNTFLGDKAKTVRVVTERASNSVILISGPADKLEQAKKLIAELDKPKNPGDKPYKFADPELHKYSVPAGTADAIAKTLLAEDPSLRIIAVQAANEIWVMATTEEHAEIAKVIGIIKPDTKKREK